jgi:hypothetical protein
MSTHAISNAAKETLRITLMLSAAMSVAALTACSKSGPEGAASEPAMAADAMIGSCLVSESTCDEYQNQPGLKESERSVTITMTKGACSQVQHGTWRDGKGCEKKGEIGHCTIAKSGNLKHTSYSFKGEEDVAASACTTLYEGKWESGLEDDALLASCVKGTGCEEIRNNKAASADLRAALLKNERDSCGRLSGEYRTDKGCETAKATATCTKKSPDGLNSVYYELSSAKQAIADSKELCGITEGKFEVRAKK